MLLTSFGLGRLRPAPGTWGSMPPVVIGAGLLVAGPSPAGSGAAWAVWVAVHLVVCVTFSLICAVHGSVGEAALGRKDPGAIVADETAGMALTLALLPAGALDHGLAAWIALPAAFLAFRAADILKPWPANGLQRLHAGWGILLDDLAAAVYAAGAMWGLWLAALM